METKEETAYKKKLALLAKKKVRMNKIGSCLRPPHVAR